MHRGRHLARLRQGRQLSADSFRLSDVVLLVHFRSAVLRVALPAPSDYGNRMRSFRRREHLRHPLHPVCRLADGMTLTAVVAVDGPGTSEFRSFR